MTEIIRDLHELANQVASYNPELAQCIHRKANEIEDEMMFDRLDEFKSFVKEQIVLEMEHFLKAKENSDVEAFRRHSRYLDDYKETQKHIEMFEGIDND